MPAARAQPAEQRCSCRHFIDVERLGIEFACEAHDLLGGHVIAAVIHDLSDRKVFEEKFRRGHGHQALAVRIT